MPFTTVFPRRLLALLLLGAVVAIAVALSGGGTAKSEDAPATASQTSPDQAYPQPPDDVVESRRAQFAQEFSGLPESGGGDIPATFHLSDPGLDVGASRQLSAPPARRLAGDDEAQPPEADVFVTPRADGAECLVAVLPDGEGGGVTCNMPEQAAEGYFLMTTSMDNVISEIYGLMPDGVDEVLVRLADGSNATLPVIDNAYLARFDQPTASITWEDPDGEWQSLTASSGA